MVDDLSHSRFEAGHIGSKVLMVGSYCRTLRNISTFTASGAYRYHTFPKNNSLHLGQKWPLDCEGGSVKWVFLFETG